ncbi:hypothetical protein HK413_09475 [Mucilaginibacter sp. S1162]|uniref:Uncharacterized protein n=1 Tax=Mucilaginibacter humi TaxID=2732510 RepID=A0ABX1W706_9SPHI|nr:hypothetical protein [Mucilaginibacter humi]NNU34320.1 hypothetical protein [Mucilaginibacter humi]
MKSNQKSSHTGGFFAAQALCAANQLKPKARSFCRLLSRKATPSGKITNAFATARPTLFYLISPEAARMTVLGYLPRF